MRLDEAFALSCNNHRNRQAIVDAGKEYTYSELLNRVESIAHIIESLSESRSGNICVYMNKSFDYVASIFAILKCKGTFVPIEKGLPIDQITYIITDTNAMMVLSDVDTISGATNCWVNLKSGTVTGVLTESDSIDERVAYILYTSGTTGIPKGIEITHDAALSFISWAMAEVHIKEDDILSSHAPFSFDLSVFDIYCSLFCGAKLVLMSRGLNAFVRSVAKYIINNKISIWYSVPSIIISLLEIDTGEIFQNVKTLIYAGESMPYKYINRLYAFYPQLTIYNFYGPTETNVITYYRLEQGKQYCHEIPIGYACPYADIVILDSDTPVIEPNSLGELCVKSQSTMLGYHNRPRLREGEYYRTGDLVRIVDTNCYEFVGRKDNMVKVNGFRVELEEIEYVLESYPSVVHAVVKVKREGNNDILVAYYSSDIPLDQREIRTYLLQYLQTYKVPAKYERVASIPINDRGKKVRDL